MSDVGKGTGLGFGLVFGILAAVVTVIGGGTLLLCGGCAAIIGGGAAVVDESIEEAENVRARQVAQRDEALEQQPVEEDSPEESDEPPKPSDDEEPIDRSIVITMDEYRRLTNGMTYDEAYDVIGYHGEELSRVSIADIETVMLAWQNRFGSNANATFQNGRLVSKAQAGLPNGPSPLNVARRRREAQEAQRLAEEEEKARIERAKDEEQRAMEIDAMEEKASAGLDALLSEAGTLDTTDSIDSFVEQLESFQAKHSELNVADKAKKEMNALGVLRLAVHSEQSRRGDPDRLLRTLVDQYPDTIAADRAAAKLDEN